MWGAGPRLGSSWAFMQRPLQTRPHISTVFVGRKDGEGHFNWKELEAWSILRGRNGAWEHYVVWLESMGNDESWGWIGLQYQESGPCLGGEGKSVEGYGQTRVGKTTSAPAWRGSQKD